MMRLKSKTMVFVFTFLLLLSLGITGCRKNDKSQEANENSSSSLAESTDESAESADESAEETSEEVNMSPEMKIIVDAAKATSEKEAFEMTSNAEVKLGGNIVNGTFHVESDAKVLRPKNQSMQMSGWVSTDLDDVVTKSGYVDGIYYEDNGSEKKKEEKSEEEVLALVSDITDMIENAAESVEDIKSSTDDDGNSVYDYQVPYYVADHYLDQLLETLDIEEIDGGDISVDSAEFISTVDQNGYLVKQEILAKGEIRKLIVKVPAEVEIEANFKDIDETDLQVETW